MSQRELAARAGSTQAAISRYERGLSSPSMDTLTRLVEAAGARIEVTIDGVPPDTALIRSRLALSPAERLRQAGAMARFVGAARQTMRSAR